MKNFATYFAIEKKIHNKGIHLDREFLIGQFTDDKKDSLRDLSPLEYSEFITWLNQTFDLMPSKKKYDNKEDQYLNKQRRKIIALLSKMGYTTKEDKADMSRIYAWVETHGYLHKSLNLYTLAELPKLVYQAEMFYKSHIQRL